MATYKELLAQKAKLDAQLEHLRNEEREGVIAEIHEKMRDYQIPLDEIGGKGKGQRSKSTRASVVAKYRDPETGREWSGRGKPPSWIKGVSNRDKFLIG